MNTIYRFVRERYALLSTLLALLFVIPAQAANLVTNGNFSGGTAGWTTWSATNAESLAVLLDAQQNAYGRFSAAPTTNSLLIYGGMAIWKDTPYTISYEISTSAANVQVNTFIRRTDNYDNIAPMISTTAGPSWQTVTRTVTFSETYNGNNVPLARIDFEVPSGAVMSVRNVQVIEPSRAPRIYYVDSTAGDDALNGLSASAIPGSGPWKNLSRIANEALQPGDQVLLKCGGIWNETLHVTRSGTAAAPISFGTYGDCSANAKPEVRKSRPITAWQPYQGNIWAATVDFDVRQVVVAGKVLPVARVPKISADPKTSPQMLRVDSALSCASLSLTMPPNMAQDLSCAMTHKSADLPLFGGNSLVGGEINVRDNAYRMDRRRIASHEPATGKITWTTSVADAGKVITSPFPYPLAKNHGYFLSGLPWMLTEAGEWAKTESGSQRTLYVRMPDSTAPPSSAASPNVVLASENGSIGISTSGQYINFKDIQVNDASTGISLAEANTPDSIRFSGMSIKRSVRIGVDVANAKNVSVTQSEVIDTGYQALNGNNASSLTLDASRVLRVGTHIPPRGDSESNLNFTAVSCADCANTQISNNLIFSSGYIGIDLKEPKLGTTQSTVQRNTVTDSCVYLDDCGAIYTGGRNGVPNRLTIKDNIVRNANGSPIGRPMDSSGNLHTSSAQGIYLDDMSYGVNVIGNTVINADSGLQLHLARGNLVQNNVFYGNRNHDVWLQEDHPDTTGACADPMNCVVGNQLLGNLFFTAPGVPTLDIVSNIGSSTDFGIFDANMYASPFNDRLAHVYDITEGVTTDHNYTLETWRSARNSDLNGHGPAFTSSAPHGAPVGANLVANGSFTAGSTLGWSSWSEAQSQGGQRETLSTASDISGTYGHFVASAYPSILIYSGFPLTASRSYVVGYDVRTTAGIPFTLKAYLRATSDYRNISSEGSAEVGSAWKSAFTVVTASATVGSGGARLDLEMPAGVALDIRNVRVQELAAAPAYDATGSSYIFIGGEALSNGSTSPLSYACPDSNTTRCSQYVNAATGAAVVWPLQLAARETRIVVATGSGLDSDADGVADSNDLCSNTQAGESVDENGCTYLNTHPSADIALSAPLSLAGTAGTPFTYVMDISNAGPSSATGSLAWSWTASAAGFRVIGTSHPGCTNTGNIVSCALGGLANNAAAQVSVQVLADSAMQINTVATLGSNVIDPQPANNQVNARLDVAAAGSGGGGSNDADAPLPLWALALLASLLAGTMRRKHLGH